MPLGIVVERREVDNPWQDHVWRAVAVIPGAAETEAWRVLNEGPGWVQYHAGTLPLELHRKETEAYRINLSDEPPVIYVVLREGDEEDEAEIAPFVVTASAYDAQDFLDCGEDIVEGVPMPEGVIAWVQEFVTRHHVDEPFVKRKRKRHDAQKEPFTPGRIPLGRINGGGGGHG